jgi:nucleoside-diphosphate-sugar epimerase
MTSQRKVLVTGATGFLGRNVLAALAARSDIHAIAGCRTPERLVPGLAAEVRVGDLRDPAYRRSVVRGVDAVCHAGTWGAFWGNARRERRLFLEPARDLVECAIESGVERFIQNSTVVIAGVRRDATAIDDDATPRRTRRWPHVDCLVDLDEHMRAQRDRGTRMITLRLGHFVGRGNALGLLPALVPRLRTRLVPWLAGGRSRLPLVADTDLGEAFALAATAGGLDTYESFNICGPSFSTTREVLELVAEVTGVPRPRWSVPFGLAYAFGWLLEALHPIIPGKEPLLTRSIVHVAEDWWCTTDRAAHRLGYVPRKDWRVAAREALDELAVLGYPWARLRQAV